MFFTFMGSWLIVDFSFRDTFSLWAWYTIPTVMLRSFDSKHFTKEGGFSWIRNNIFQFGTYDIIIPTNFDFIHRINWEIIFFTRFIHVYTYRGTNTIDSFFTLNKIKRYLQCHHHKSNIIMWLIFYDTLMKVNVVSCLESLTLRKFFVY